MGMFTETDTWEMKALKIWEDMEVNQSCLVTGYQILDEPNQQGRKVLTEGELIIERLRDLDRTHNLISQGKKMVRRRKYIPDSIGGFIAHKIFRFKMQIIDGHPRYTFWRVQ